MSLCALIYGTITKTTSVDDMTQIMIVGIKLYSSLSSYEFGCKKKALSDFLALSSSWKKQTSGSQLKTNLSVSWQCFLMWSILYWLCTGGVCFDRPEYWKSAICLAKLWKTVLCPRSMMKKTATKNLARFFILADLMDMCKLAATEDCRAFQPALIA